MAKYDLLKLAESFPDVPGVYKMKDGEGHLLYVGKAKSLKKRVKFYFQKDTVRSTRTRKLLEQTYDIEYIVTDTELEALLLETNLIKEFRPRYNILMKDDKSFVYIKVILDEDYPRIRIVRQREKEQMDKSGVRENARYFGPKTSTTKVYEIFRILKRLFPFRHCQLDIAYYGEGKGEGETAGLPQPETVKVTHRVIDYPCLDYSIKRCPGPCVGAISPTEYKKIVQQIIDFLEGKTEKIVSALKNQMMVAAANRQYEKAARIRDKLLAIEAITERQKISDPERVDTDVINFFMEMGKTYFNLFMIRDGKLINQENFILDVFELKDTGEVSSSEILEAFLKQYYEKVSDFPREIFIPEPIQSEEVYAEWLKMMNQGHPVKILIPLRGEKSKLLELSRKNALNFAKQSRVRWMKEAAEAEAINELASNLELKPEAMKRIECFDISHLSGNETVGSMVVFENGFPRREHYRHFKLRTVQGKPDDFASMTEVLARRFKYLTEEKHPDIMLRGATKKDFEEIQKIVSKEPNLSKSNFIQKEFIVAKRDTKIVGFGRLHKLDEKVSHIATLWVSPDARGSRLGYKIMKKLIDRSKLKRMYLTCTKDLEEYYAVFGFTAIHQVPEVLEKWVKNISECECVEGEPIYMVFDKTKRKEDPSFTKKPDLILLDGGKPQLSAGLQALKKFSLSLPIASLAKRFEEIYLPGKEAPVLLPENSEALKLLQRLRDEAHRFAITFQRDLHRKVLIGQA